MSSSCIQNLKILSEIEAEKFVTENFVREKENGQIQGLISHMWLIFGYTVKLVIPDVVPNFKILGQEVSKKSLTENSLHTHRHTNIRTEKAKTINPYILRIPGV